MAISKIRPLHGRNGESFIKTLKDREDYGVNPDKTDQGRLNRLPMQSTLCVQRVLRDQAAL
ncbi:MAG: hypothetical protein ABF449_10710 [Ethanoligenens sp.]